MSRDASITLDFAGEERVFRLSIGRWRVVQEKCDAGPSELLRRYLTDSWRVDDLREVLRQGLIGGGGPNADVGKIDALLRREFDDLPLLPFVPVCQAIVMASLVGAPDEDEIAKDAGPGEGDAGAGEPPASPAASSTSATSTARPPRSRSRRKPSTS